MTAMFGRWTRKIHHPSTSVYHLEVVACMGIRRERFLRPPRLEIALDVVSLPLTG